MNNFFWLKRKPASSRGAKSITTKVLIPVLAVLTIGGVGLLWCVRWTTEREMEAEAIASAEAMSRQFDALRSYYNEAVIKKVQAKGALKVSAEHKGNDDTIPLPATLLADLSELISKDPESAQVQIYSSRHPPEGPDGKPDAFALEAFAFMEKHPDSNYVKRITEAGQPTIHIAVPDKLMGQSCLVCHDEVPQGSSDAMAKVKGVLEVKLPIGRQAKANTAMTWQISGIIAALLAVMASLVVWLVIRTVVRPLRTTGAVLDLLATGDFTAACAVESQDEIGRIGMALNQTVDRLRTSITQVVNNSEQVGSAAESVSEIGRGVSTQASETSSCANGAASATEQISRSASSVAAASEEMSVSIREIAKQANDAAHVVGQAVAAADRVNSIITALSGSSQEIGTVVKDIRSIAEQTNLLALNATIEAARAGDAGKGFAVVAGEVKELARQTARATEAISQRVTGIQSQTGSAISALQEITGVIGQVHGSQTAIASAVEEQAATMSEISRNSQETSRSGTELANTVLGASKMADGSRQAATQLASASADLTRLSHNLLDAVKHFKVRDQGALSTQVSHSAADDKHVASDRANGRHFVAPHRAVTPVRAD